jgi:hypothetical protein
VLIWLRQIFVVPKAVKSIVDVSLWPAISAAKHECGLSDLHLILGKKISQLTSDQATRDFLHSGYFCASPVHEMLIHDSLGFCTLVERRVSGDKWRGERLASGQKTKAE